MRNNFTKILILIVTIILTISVFDLKALEINKEKSRIMVEHGDKALMEKDFDSAKIYYKQAIQYDPFNKVAFDKYENLIRITTTNSNIDLSVFGSISKSKKDAGKNESGKSEPSKSETKKTAPAPTKALEFQGC